MNSSGTYLHPDYGPSGDPANPYGMPWTITSGSTPKTPVSFQYASESDPGPYPFTATTPIEGGAGASGDRHALMVDSSTCTLYELYDAHYAPPGAGGSTAGSGAIWSLNSDNLRPDTWTSSDAAGLPILPLLVNYDQVASGSMNHAIRVTAACTSQAHLWPARHDAGGASNCPPMGARFRLAAGFSLPASQCDSFCQTVLNTMKTYGLIVADNGSNWYFGGTADVRWTYQQVDQLKAIPARDFQAVDTSCLEMSAGSAAAYQPGSAGYSSACGGVSPPTPGPNDCNLSAPVSAISAGQTPGSYWRVDHSGRVCASGGASWHGDLASVRLAAPIIGMQATPGGGGYWLLGADGGVFSFGNAVFHGSTGNLRLAAPVVAMASTTDAGGYWLVASDGGVFSFGDARFRGSMGGQHLAKPVVGMAVAPGSDGYWLVASDGGVFAFTPYGFYGSMGNHYLARPVVGMASSPDGRGYTLVASDGGVFDFGDARFYGSLGAHPPSSPVVDLAPVPAGTGYYLLSAAGQVYSFGPGA
jgi:hypothetical protein